MAEVQDAPDSLFDVIPAELFDNFLRFFSLLPNSKSWETHIELGDVSALFPLPNKFGSFTKSRFDTLRVGETKFSRHDVPHGAHLWAHSIDVAHKYILAGGGQSLKALELAMLDRVSVRNSLVEDFVNHCPNLSSLSITYRGNYWAQKFGEQIEKLEVMVDAPLDSPWTFPSLRELTLTLHTDQISPEFWMYIGRRLEKLVVHQFVSLGDKVGDIEQHCRKLKYVSLMESSARGISAIISLLTSYGNQLEHAQLFTMNEEQVLEVIEACPNARFNLLYFKGRFSSAGIGVIGPKLDRITSSDFTAAGGDDAEWTNVWDKCSKIRELHIYEAELDFVQYVFSKPKIELKTLSFCFGHNASEEDGQKVMKVCAERTKCIEHFTFSGPLFYGDASSKFLKANRASLKKISMTSFWYGDGEKLNELLDSILDLPVLEELYINCGMSNDRLKTLFERGIYWKTVECFYDTPGVLYPCSN